MKVAPLRFRELRNGFLFADEAGQFFSSDSGFLQRYVFDRLSPADLSFLRSNGQAYNKETDFYFFSYLRRWAARQNDNKSLSYVILVPTLRCDLACSYCQVSRVSERARGFDWDDEQLKRAQEFLAQLETDDIKIEFQGGEPLLRLDVLQAVTSFCETHFSKTEIVICTNLQHLDEEALSFFEKDNVFISTSLDGSKLSHERHRTQDATLTKKFFANLELVLRRFGTEKVSALPTIDYSQPPDLEGLLRTYTSYGLRSIYLRPVNYQGFARKKFSFVQDDASGWNEIYDRFIDLIIEHNSDNRDSVEEYYFSLCLQRILQAGLDSHVDLRNPNPIGIDYVVVDFDGKIYPSDEARMMARVGQIDLSIGDLEEGLDSTKIDAFNLSALNNFHEDCIHCTYQPFCGVDLTDDISRYGRIDRPKANTWFCKRHLAIFDKIFELLYADDKKVRYSLARWLRVPDFPSGICARRHDTATS